MLASGIRPAVQIFPDHVRVVPADSLEPGTEKSDEGCRIQQRLLENFQDAEDVAFRAKWAVLADKKTAIEFSRLNPDWTSPGEPYQWPAGMRQQ